MKTLLWLLFFSIALGALTACASSTSSATPTSTLIATRRPRLAETRTAKSAPAVAAAILLA